MSDTVGSLGSQKWACCYDGSRGSLGRIKVLLRQLCHGSLGARR